jgi:hypothetical protein
VTAEGWDEDDGCTETEYEEIKTRWLAKYGNDQSAHHVELLTPLPARIRLRLAVHRRIDRAGAWLCGNRCARAAVWLWRASGMA